MINQNRKSKKGLDGFDLCFKKNVEVEKIPGLSVKTNLI